MKCALSVQMFDDFNVSVSKDGKTVWLTSKDGALEISLSRSQAGALEDAISSALLDADPEWQKEAERIKKLEGGTQ